MAEAGDLPALKVGKQWRFPSEQVQHWLKQQAGIEVTTRAPDCLPPVGGASAPLTCESVQLLQDAFADALGLMLVVTDMEGQPITQVSHPLPLYTLLAEAKDGHALCQEKWRQLGQVPALEPRFVPAMGGLLCARALVRMGSQLKAMVIVFGVAPPSWTPEDELLEDLAEELALDPVRLKQALSAAVYLTHNEQQKVLVTLQRVADLLAHLSNERLALLNRLAEIQRLSKI